MNSLAVLICGAFLLSAGSGVYLRLRQIAFVRDHREETPPHFRADVSADEHERAADDTVDNANMFIADPRYAPQLLSLTLLLARAPLYGDRLRGRAGLCGGASPSFWPSRPLQACRSSLLAGAHLLARRPLRARQAEARGFFLDWIKSSALEFALGAPMLLGMFALLAAFRTAGGSFAYPRLDGVRARHDDGLSKLIAPLFNTFTPMPQDALRERLEALLDRCDFSAQNLYVMDASKRTTRGNAYFAGFGKTRRIVLFDTLIESILPTRSKTISRTSLGHSKSATSSSGMVVDGGCCAGGSSECSSGARLTGLVPSFGFLFEPNGFVIMLLVRQWSWT